MRRKPTALTRTIAGAALAASAAVVIPVWAQQNPPAAESGRAQAPTSPMPAPEPTPAPAQPPAAAPDPRAAAAQANTVYGIGVSRGARYLVRNGLDYIEYQEYERALKYLREAEARQAELTAAEKLVLKQGIENAQRGLREAVGAKTPYAASKRRSRAGGFTVAQRPKEAQGRTRAAEAAVAAASRNVGIDADAPPEPKGDPIRLASGSSADDDGANVIRADASVQKAPAAAQADAAAKVTAAAAAALTHVADVADAPDPAPLPDLDQLATSAPSPTTAQSTPPAEPPSVLPKAEGANPADVANAKTAEADLGSPLPAFDPPVPPTAQPKPDVTPAPAPAPVPVPIQLETIGEKPPTTQPAPAATNDAEAKVDAKAAPAAEPPAPSPAAVPVPIQLETIGEKPPTTQPAPAPAIDRPASAEPQPAATDGAEAKVDAKAAPAAGTNADDDLPPLPSDISLSAGSAAPLPTAVEPPAAEAAPAPAPVSAINPMPVAEPAPMPVAEPAPMPVAEPAPMPVAEPAPMPVAEPAPMPVAEPAPEVDRLPPLPAEAEAVPVPPADVTGEQKAATVPETPTQPETPAVVESAVPAPAPADLSAASPSPSPASVPSTEAVPVSSAGSAGSELEIPQRANPVSRLSEEMQREVEQIARQQDEMVRRRQIQDNSPAPGSARNAGASPYRDGSNNYGTQSQVDISRAPSPAQARPIHAIPVPEDYVPLVPRDWSPQRKYWSAAGTCHMPLYFQDAALERYGHSVEQFFGPAARFLSWPLDDPTQSTQRNQILQPVFSIGLFAFQIAALPYNLVVDPPWEAEYDLGYYRPGDRVPTDIYYLPLHGVGPPLKGKRY